MAKRNYKKPIVDSKRVYEYIEKHPGCSVPEIAKKFPKGSVRSVWATVSSLKKKGMVDNKWKGQWEVVDGTSRRVKRSSTTKNIKVAKLVIEIDISLKV